MAPETAFPLSDLPKQGDAVAAAKLAGIMAAKRTSDLIPLCHPLPLTHVDVRIEVGEEGVDRRGGRDHRTDRGRWRQWSQPRSRHSTIYDMAKAIDSSMELPRVSPARVGPREQLEVRAAVLTVSDGVAGRTREDESGELARRPPPLRRAMRSERRVVPDDPGEIARPSPSSPRRPRSSSPPAVPASRRATSHRRRRPRCSSGRRPDRGSIRADSIAKTPHGLLSRGIAGVRGEAQS